MTHYLWDKQNIRYQLVTTHGGQVFNWLFVPGGPGADSSYLRELVEALHLPGNAWLIDLPNNGSNIIHNDYDFNQWFDLLLPTISQFKNPVYVGQSFGGMLPLLYPELEDLLKGLVILNSSPVLWHDEAHRVAAEKGKPSLIEPLQKFTDNPTQDTFKQAFMACAPYYFPDKTLERGKLLLDALPFNYHAASWWQNKVEEIQFDARWIPQKLPTLIIGGTEDCMTPPSLFLNDKRFKRDNVELITIKGAGHMPWLEDLQSVIDSFEQYIENIPK